MLFFEFGFLFLFLPVAVGLHRALPPRLRNGWLFLASLLFYISSSWFYAPILLGTIALDYFVGGRISDASSPTTRRRWLILSLVTNLGLLGYFKYIGFLTSSIRDLGLKSMPHIDAALPVGISFFVFQSMSYTIDLYRNEVKRARSIVDFGAFVTLYPQLIAGPIVRYADVAEAMIERHLNLDDLAKGLRLLSIGLAKKLIVADTLAAFADPILAVPRPGLIPAWAAILFYGGQIYFDFSAYSDMARGLGHMLGFHFPINFDSPYQSRSFAEFWRRWHITLSTWLRDYLYVPLGGNRGSLWRTMLNLMITMLLGGLWHGASWNFVVWGGLHGTFLAVERLIRGRSKPAPTAGLVRRALEVAGVFIGVHVAWAFFRIEGLEPALEWVGAMFGSSGELGSISLEASVALLLMLGILWGTPNSSRPAPSWTIPRAAWAAGLFTLSLLIGYSRNISPFLYFRF